MAASSPVLSSLILALILSLLALQSNGQKPCTISVLDVATVEVYLQVSCSPDGRSADSASLKPGESVKLTASKTVVCDLHLRELDGKFTLYDAKKDAAKCRKGELKWQVGWGGVYELQGNNPVLRYRWPKSS